VTLDTNNINASSCAAIPVPALPPMFVLALALGLAGLGVVRLMRPARPPR